MEKRNEQSIKNGKLITVDKTTLEEHQLIGGLLLEPSYIEEINLNPDDFSSKYMAELYTAIMLAYGDGSDITKITDYMHELYDVDKNTVAKDLAKLMNDVIASVNTPIYAKKIKEVSVKRKLADTVNRIDWDKDTDKIIRELELALAKVEYNTKVTPISKDFDWEEIDRLIQSKTFHSHLPSLNEAIRLTRGELLTIVGDTSRGKTMLALNLVDDILKQKGKVLYLSMDMTRPALIMRLASMHQRIPLWKIKPDSPDFKRIFEIELNQDYANYLYEYHNSEEISTVIHIARAINPDVVVFDYIQNFIDSRVREGRVAELRSILLSLQKEAQRYPIIALSQVSKGDSDDYLARAKGSSTIAQASSIVLEMDKNEDGYRYRVRKNRTWGTTTDWIRLHMDYGVLTEAL